MLVGRIETRLLKMLLKSFHDCSDLFIKTTWYVCNHYKGLFQWFGIEKCITKAFVSRIEILFPPSIEILFFMYQDIPWALAFKPIRCWGSSHADQDGIYDVIGYLIKLCII